MLRRSGPRRAAFTLIELLVVISIIAVVIGLTIAAVMRALDVGPRADTTSRITAMSKAIGTWQSEKGVTFIPGGRVQDDPNQPGVGSVIGPFRLRNIYFPLGDPRLTAGEPDNTSFEARYIKRVWPNADIDGTLIPNDPKPGLGNSNNVNFRGDLDANQTLLFFLNGIADPDGKGGFAFRGFSKNPQKPFEPFDPNNPSQDRTKIYLDISNKHYVAPVNATFNATANPNPNPTPNPNYPWLVDGWRRPFAYFAAYNGKPARVPAATPVGSPAPPTAYDGWNRFFGTPNVPDVTFAMGTPKAYFNGNKYELESGHQIISAGKDGKFGTSGDWNKVTTPDGQDDRVNFSTNNLGAGPK